MAMVLHCSTAVSLDVKSSSIIQHLYTCYLCSYNIINSVRDLQINLYTNILNHLDMYKKKKKDYGIQISKSKYIHQLSCIECFFFLSLWLSINPINIRCL